MYPFEPRRDRDGTINTLAALVARHKVDLIAIGNGTASRESEKLVGDMMERFPDLKVTRVVVSEAGASVYSASETAALEFPDLDVTPARRRFHRAPPAGSAGRTGQDRSQGHWRGASTSMTSTSASWRVRWTPWSRIA